MIAIIARALTTLGMWGTGTILSGILITSVRYTTSKIVGEREIESGLPGTDTIMVPIFETITEIMPSTWLLLVGVLVFTIVVGMVAATFAIWTPTESADAALPSRIGGKVKREQEARIRRLLARMNDPERTTALAALENARIGDDGERLSMAEVIRERDG